MRILGAVIAFLTALVWSAVWDCRDLISKLRDELVECLIEYARSRPAEDIFEMGELYLTRYYLFGRKASSHLPHAAVRFGWLPTVRVHHFHKADAGRAQHNHPWWWAVAFVLRGSYVEERGRRRRVVRRLNVLTRSTFHRVALLEGDVWTLFISGRYAGPWGFLVDGRVVPWRKFVEERDEQSPTPHRRGRHPAAAHPAA